MARRGCDRREAYLRRARAAVLLRQLQRALLPVFALPADLLAALELEPQFSNLLRDGGTHSVTGRVARQSRGTKIASLRSSNTRWTGLQTLETGPAAH